MFGEVVLAILNPSTRSLGPIYLSQLHGAVMGAPLPLGESLIIAWPQIVGLVAGYDPAVRSRLHRLPTAGSAGLDGQLRLRSDRSVADQIGGHVQGAAAVAAPFFTFKCVRGQTAMTATILWFWSTMMI